MRAERMPWNRVPPLAALTTLWLVLLGGPDLYAHIPYLRAGTLLDRSAYGLVLAGSWALFVGVMQALIRLRARRPKLALGLSALYGLWIAVAVALAVPYRVRFGQDLPSSYLTFWLQNHWYGWKLFRTETGPVVRKLMAVAIVTVSVLIVAFARVRHLRSLRLRTSRALVAAGLVLLALSINKKRASLPADFHEARVAVATLTLSLDPGRLPVGARPVLAPIETPVRPNVLILLGESLSANEFSPWNGRDDSPGMAPFITANPGGLVAFLHANASASATDLSVPSILTGLRSDVSSKDFARAPLLWHEARARGYATGLFSSQDYAWLHLGEFLLGADQPDVVKVMADFPGAPQVNDGAIDDALAVDAANAFIDSVPTDRPFFVVMHFNATHFPSWAPGLDPIQKLLQDLPQLKPTVRRPKALEYVQMLQERMLEHLIEAGRFDETLVISTADHGVVSRDKAPSRLESHYEDVLRIPLGIHLPRSLATARPEALAALLANSTERTSNADIYPTVLDVWGAEPVVSADRPQLRGNSLLRPLPDRMLLSMSSGPVRGWHRHGFALYHNHWKWYDDDQDGLRVYDLGADPQEATNLYGRVPAHEQALFLAEIRKSRQLLRVLEDTAPELLGP